MKVLVKLTVAIVAVLVVLSLVNPTFGTFLGERIGYVLGFAFVALGAASPLLVVGILLWLLIFRKKRPAKTYAAVPQGSPPKPSEPNAVASKATPQNTSRPTEKAPTATPSQSNELGNYVVSATPKPKHVKALKVIEYSPNAATAWNSLQSLPDKYQTSFLDALEDNPNEDAAQLASRLSSEHQRELRPYDSEDANEALEQARTISPEAEEEFKTVYKLVGESVDTYEILSKIENKFGPSEATQRRIAAERLEKERLRQKRIDQEHQENNRVELLRQKRLEEEKERDSRTNVGLVIATSIFLIFIVLITNHR